MNARRIADLHLELARVHAELAKELGADPNDASSPESPAPARAKPPRKPRAIVRPAGNSSPESAAAADRILRERGLR